MTTDIIDAIQYLRDHKKYSFKSNEPAGINEEVIRREIESNIVYVSSKGNGLKCLDEANATIYDYFDACQNTGVLFKDDIHNDIIDVFRWLRPNDSLYACRENSNSFECCVKSYFNMKHLLNLDKNINVADVDESEETLKVPMQKLTQDVNNLTTKFGGTPIVILKLLYDIVSDKMWDDRASLLSGIKDGDFIAVHIKSRLPYIDSDDIDDDIKHLCTTIKNMYPDLSTKDMCTIFGVVYDYMRDISSVSNSYNKFQGPSYPWKHAVYECFSKLSGPPKDETTEIANESFTTIFTDLDAIYFLNNEEATEAASREEITSDKEAKKIAKNSLKDAEKEKKKHERAQKFNDTKNNISNAWTKFKNKEEAIDNQLDKITRGLKDIVFDTNSKKTREDVIQGGKHWTPIQVLGRVLAGYAIFSYSKIAAIALFVTRHYTRKNCTKQERRKAIVELEHEIKIVEEKINDAQANGDQKAKYALMRTKNSLESSLDQIRNSYKKMPDAELKGAKKALINVEVNQSGNDK